MYKILKIMFAGAIALSLGACGGEEPVVTFDNVQPCKDAGTAVNDLSCTAADLIDLDATCPASWDGIELDYTDYIACLFGQHTCDATDTYVFTDGTCTLPEPDPAGS